MVRLFAVKTAIAVLSRAITISSKLRTRTWGRLAIVQALLAVSCFWAYHSFEGPERVETRLLTYKTSGDTDLDLYIYDPQSITVASYDWGDEFVAGSSFNGSVKGTNFRSDIHASIIVGFWDESEYPFAFHFSLDEQPDTSVLLTSRSTDSWEPFDFPNLLRFETPAVLQVSGGESKSPIDVVVKMMLLFQAIIFSIGSVASSVFLYLNYQRGKLDLKLKALQVREMEIKLENMERERASMVQEAAQSGIILLS
jgi:hypothetical protein